MASIEVDRSYRDHRLGPGPTLYEVYDRPQLERLREVQEHALHLVESILRAERSPLFRGLLPLHRLPRTPVFDYVPPYRRIQRIIMRYLGSSLSLLEEHSEERIKATSRMYEQWVFLQIAAALKTFGLECEDIQGLLRRTAAQRFTLDFARDTRLLFRASDGRVLSIRYEPWVLAAHSARGRGDTIYRGQVGDAPWSPDILLELLSRDDPDDLPRNVEYAIVVDAKYSQKIVWTSTDKYLQIRATATNRQVVRQVWLAHPLEGLGIICRDPAVAWSEHGPTRPMDETIQGAIGLVPSLSTRDEDSRTPFALEVAPAALAFVRGLLAYLRLEGRETRGTSSHVPNSQESTTPSKTVRSSG